MLQDIIVMYRRMLAGTAPKVAHRIIRLVEHLHTHEPMLVKPEHLGWMRLLARHPWVRPLAAWRAPAGSLSSKRDHLVQHLLVRFPVPEHLFLAFEATQRERASVLLEDGWAAPILASLGCGVSLRVLVGTDALPTPLTRRMCHDFLRAPRVVRPIVALRLAQIAAGGGSPALVAPLVRGPLGRMHALSGGADEPYWDQVIRWLCRCPDSATLKPQQWDELLLRIEIRRRQGDDIRLVGRPLRAVLREVTQLGIAERRARGDGFAASGFRALEQGTWSFHEILTPEDLHAEGEALRHCVWSYRDDIRSNTKAIWSLRREGHRAVTIEVDLRLGRIRQVRGFANRACLPPEMDVLRRWAQHNGLSLAA